MKADMAQRERDLATLERFTSDILDDHKRRLEEMTFQSELATKSWHEVAMAKLKDDLADHQSTYKDCTKDFFEEQLQNLERNLDSYAEHARGI